MTDAAGEQGYMAPADAQRLTAELDACERAMLALHESTQRLTAERDEWRRSADASHLAASNECARANGAEVEVQRLTAEVHALEAEREQARRNIAALRSDEALRVAELRQAREGCVQLRASWEHERADAQRLTAEVASMKERLTKWAEMLTQKDTRIDDLQTRGRALEEEVARLKEQPRK